LRREIEFSFSFGTDSNDVGQAILNRGFSCYTEAARKAEKLGFKAFIIPDHFMRPKPRNSIVYESWTALAALATQTTTILLGTGVTPVTFYSPSILAKRVASLDHMSKGRTIFGAGSGWICEEFEAYGVPFDPPGIRFQKMIEGIEIIKGLWTSEDPFTYHGKYYALKDAVLLPKPLQKPHPPIWLGGRSTRVLKATVKYGQGWYAPGTPTTPPQMFEEKVAQIKKLARQTNRDPEEMTYAIGVGIRELADREEETKRQTKECVARIQEYVEAGATHVLLGVRPIEKVLDGIQILAEEVIPYV